MDPGSRAYRDDGGKKRPPPPAQMHTGETKEKDPGSRPESQRVASCANRLVVTPVAYGDDGDETLDPGSRPENQRVTSCANRLVVTSSAYRDDGEETGS